MTMTQCTAHYTAALHRGFKTLAPTPPLQDTGTYTTAPTPRTYSFKTLAPTPRAPTPRAPTPRTYSFKTLAPTPRAPTPRAPTPLAPTPRTYTAHLHRGTTPRALHHVQGRRTPVEQAEQSALSRLGRRPVSAPYLRAGLRRYREPAMPNCTPRSVSLASRVVLP